jgi:hypothetical protein
MIKIELETDDKFNVSVTMQSSKQIVMEELQAVNTQLDLLKMKILGEIAKITNIEKGEEI